MEPKAYDLIYRTISQKETYFAEDLTLIMVLTGSVLLDDEGKSTLLTVNQLYCANLNHFITLTPQTEANQLLFLKIDSLFFASQFPAFFDVTFALPDHLSHASTGNLRAELVDLAINEFSTTEEQNLYRMMKLETILLLLVQKFQEKRRHETILAKHLRLRDILEYIDQNYAKGIKAKEIAEHFFLSESALSKAFKHETGEYLSRYLKKIQTRKSLTELLYTKKSMEELALDYGFNSAKVYREQFKLLFGTTPAEYRRCHHEKRRTETSLEMAQSSVSAPKDILQLLYAASQTNSSETLTTHLKRRSKQLSLTITPSATEKKASELIIQISSLSDLGNKRTQNELLLLQKKQALSCINCLHLFLETSISYNLARQAQMNSFPEFEELDEALLFLQNQQLDIMLTLTAARVEALTKDVYLHFFQHVRRKFGRSLLQRFRINFEFTDLSAASESALYQELYAHGKYLSEHIKVGIKLPFPDPYDEEQIHVILQQFHPLLKTSCDFLSFTAEPNFIFKEPALRTNDLSRYHRYVLTKTRTLLKALTQQKMDLPVYLLEWNTLTGTTITYNGLFFRGAIIVADMLQLDNLIAGYGFWLNIESHELEAAKKETAKTGLDLFHFQSKKRPSYYCLELVKRMQGEVLSEGDSHLFMKHPEKYQLLVWNTNYFDPHLSSEEAFMESQSLDISLLIKGIPDGLYQVKQLDLDRNHGAVFYVYSQFQEAKQLDHETEDYISTKTQMDLQVFDTVIQQEFSHFLTLDTNAVALLEFTPL